MKKPKQQGNKFIARAKDKKNKFINFVKDKKNKFITYAKNNKKKVMIISACSVFVILFLCTSVIGYIHKTKKQNYVEEVVSAEETTQTTTEVTSETTTLVSESTTETTTLEPCHFNADGKLYGTKGKYSGLWPTLEAIVNASDEKWTALKEWVGDNSELQKSNYEEDNFVAINGYGTVHWAQSGHKWYTPYSIADDGSSSSSATLIFESIASEKVTVDLDKAVEEQEQKYKDVVPVTEAATEAVTKAAQVATSAEKTTNTSSKTTEKPKTDEKNKAEEGTTVKEAATQATTAQQTANEPAVSDTAVDVKKENSVSSNSGKASTSGGSGGSGGSGSSSGGRYVVSGGTWGSDSCGVCSLAMVLSTLSGVTVSPPEVALAANALIGEKAWYKTILYSQSQAKLAELAGFTVKTEPYNKATQAAMNECLDNNGMAVFVTDDQTWASGGGKHYIAVRNRVGDKYYTCDSGKNPTGAFTYEQISKGYNQQLIVYIFPKGYKAE